jgi:hypothetical protein
MGYRLSVDVRGTFTDLLLLEMGTFRRQPHVAAAE